MALNLDWVRAQFPALESGWTYFENAGGSQILRRAVDRIQEFLLTSNVQLGASYELSRLAGKRVNEEAAGAFAVFLNAADPREIVFGNSTTQNLINLSSAMAPGIREGDEIIVTNTEHEANVRPWLPLVERGVRIRTWRVDPDSFELHLEDLDALLTERTRLVAVTQVSNVLGGIVPVESVVRKAHDAGARILVDGVAYAPHRVVDVRAWDVDFYALSLYKVYGPHQAVLYGKFDLLRELANINHYFIRDEDVPYKFQPGSLVYELCYGSSAIPEYFQLLGGEGSPRERIIRAFERIAEHEEGLSERLLGFLRNRRGVRIIGDPGSDRNRRVPTISFVVEGRSSAEFSAALDEHRIACRNGHFYAARLIEDLGLAEQSGVVRISMVHYNTLEEVDRLIRCLEKLL